MKNLRVNISFKNISKDLILYQYLQEKRDKSNYIKDLIEKDLKQSQVTTV